VKPRRENIGNKKAPKKLAAKKTGARLVVPQKDEQHVIPLGNGWVVKTGSSKTFTVITDNKREAVEIAKSIAKTKKSAVVVHGKFGAIERTEAFNS
jgi:Uncharacterized protein conserved in bacteria (DUF2188)